MAEWFWLPSNLNQTASHSQSRSWFNWNESEKLNKRAALTGSGSVKGTPSRSRVGVDLTPPWSACELGAATTWIRTTLFCPKLLRVWHENVEQKSRNISAAPSSLLSYSCYTCNLGFLWVPNDWCLMFTQPRTRVIAGPSDLDEWLLRYIPPPAKKGGKHNSKCSG